MSIVLLRSPQPLVTFIAKCLVGVLTAAMIVAVPGLSTPTVNATSGWQNANVSFVDVGYDHTCAIENAVLYCWGAGTRGQLGVLPPPRPPVYPPPPIDQPRPSKVNPGGGFTNTNVTTVSAGNKVTCAIENGVVYCWGQNSVGQLGNGRNTESTTPVKVSVANGFQNNGNVTAVSVGYFGACAVESGIVYCWGANGLGTVGDGTTTHRNVPRKVLAGAMGTNAGITAVAVGTTACALKTGVLYCWGSGAYGQMGNGSTTKANKQPVKVSNANGFVNSGVTSVSTIGLTVCAVHTGVLYCWGLGGYGNHGTGDRSQSTVPRPAVSANGMTNTAVTSAHAGNASCVVEGGIVYCFGTNSYGQVGDGTTTGRIVATRVSQSGAMANNGAVTQVSSDYNHACAIESGSVFCWGSQENGRLGNDVTTGNQLTPMAAASLPGVPTITSVTVGTTTATITVAAGVGGVPTSYLVTAQPGGLSCTVTAPTTSCTIAGLTSGTEYTFTATASSDQGTSGDSAGVTRTTGVVAVPGTPGVVAGDQELVVTPTPGSGGGSPTGYIAYASPGGATCTVVSPAFSCTITPLTDGVSYTVTTSAYNDAGPSSPSSPVVVVPGDPAAPLAPTVVVGFATATISVNATTSGGTPAYYTVTGAPGPVTCTVTPPETDCTITGLTNGTTYSFDMSATNNGGTSPASASTSALVDVLPIPVTDRVEVGATGVTVSVSTDPGGGTVQRYDVYLMPGGFSCTVVTTSTTSSCYVDGLTRAQTYNVTTTATNGIGTSAPSSAFPFEFEAPGQSQVGVLGIGSGTMTVTVSAGSPGGPPTSYLVAAVDSPNVFTCTVTVPDTSCDISGLTAGVTYTVTASATNGLSTSTLSAQFLASLTAPGQPTIPSVVVGNGSATVSVAPDPSSGVGIPSSYLVTATTSAGATHTCTVTNPDRSCVMSGLTNGLQYTFTTVATNAYGSSPTSSAVVAVVDSMPIPLEPTVVVGTGGVTVSVSSDPSGGSAQSYTVYIEPGGHSCAVASPATQPSCFVTLPGTGLFTVTTTATNTLFASGASPAAEVNYEAPAAPQVGAVAIAVGTVTVSVSPTTSGGPATSYLVHVGPSTCTVIPPATTCTVNGLPGGQVYPVTVSASNGAGTTNGSNQLQARLLPPNPPPAPTVLVTSGSATVLVSPPVGGETPLSYTVTAVPGGFTCTAVLPTIVCDIPGLSNGTEYTFTAVASNDFGPSTSGPGTSALVAEPATPPRPIVTPGDRRLTVRVGPGSGGGVPTAYVVEAQPDGVACTVVPPATSCVLEDLENGTEYSVTAMAVNNVGSSLQSLATPGTPRDPTVPPPPPTTTPSTTVPPTTTPSTTVPPSTTPPSTAPVTPVGVDPQTGEPPALDPGDVTVLDDGVATSAEIETVSPIEVVVRSTDFELSLVAECATGCGVTTTDDGRPVIQLEQSGNVRVNGTGFLPGTLAYVWLFSEPQLLGTVLVAADGTFEGSLPIGVLDDGEHTLQVNGISTTGSRRAANLGVVVRDGGAPVPAPVQLPATGTSTPRSGVVVGLLVIGLGVLALTSRRRRCLW